MFRRFLAPLALAAGASALLACSEAPDPAARVADADSLRSLPAGDVVGFAAEYESHAWLGLPFAEPPVGDLRWKAPRTIPPWDGTREALASGNPCRQLATPMAGVTSEPPGTPVGDEDCLTLNVYAPRFEPGAVPQGDDRLPVMVWIHGGGNTTGLADFYHGGHLAASQNVIVVAIQYRLGPFGWFRHAALRGEGTTAADRSGNYGTLDQIRALEWVQANVEGFGGDPERVTIFGESAGGRNVVMMLLSRQADGLFHRAIVQSGGTGTMNPLKAEAFGDAPVPGDRHSSGEVLARWLQADGTVADRDAAKDWLATRDDPEIADYLRGLDAVAVLEGFIDPEQEWLHVPQMFADGYVLPRQDALGRFWRGAYNRVPVILGTNRDEQRLFYALDPNYAERRWGLIPEPHDREYFFAVTDHLSDAWKATGADEPAIALHSQQPGQVWVYRFDWDEELSLPYVRLDEMLGAAHGFEIPFVFGHFDLGSEAIGIFTPFNRGPRRELSEQMMSYWAEFAYSGDPGAGRDGALERWLAWDDSTDEAHRYVIFDTESDGGVRMGSEPVTLETVVANIAADARLEEPREQCSVYRELADWAWARGFDRGDYEALGTCATYPFDDFPWQEEPADVDVAAEAAS